MYSKDDVVEIIDWVEVVGVYLVFDEIYVFFVFGDCVFMSGV